MFSKKNLSYREFFTPFQRVNQQYSCSRGMTTSVPFLNLNQLYTFLFTFTGHVYRTKNVLKENLKALKWRFSFHINDGSLPTAPFAYIFRHCSHYHSAGPSDKLYIFISFRLFAGPASLLSSTFSFQIEVQHISTNYNCPVTWWVNFTCNFMPDHQTLHIHKWHDHFTFFWSICSATVHNTS